MTSTEKLILAILAVVVMLVFMAVGGLLVLLWQDTRPASDPVQAALAPSPAATLTLTPWPTGTPASVTMAAPAQTAAMPTPTNTRVVKETPTPTPTPTVVNCINDITSFEESGLITNEEVAVYLRATIPAEHLDRCVRIRYIPLAVEQGATPVAGRFIPLFRHISVFPVSGGSRGPEDILDTLTHEVGHNVHYNMRIDNLALARQWTDLHQQDVGFVSDYARTDEFEDFAETYRVYVLQPESLQLLSPVKYRFLQVEVFAGREYAP